MRAARQEAARQRAAAHELRASAAGLTAANEVLRKEVTDLEDKVGRLATPRARHQVLTVRHHNSTPVSRRAGVGS